MFLQAPADVGAVLDLFLVDDLVFVLQLDDDGDSCPAGARRAAHFGWLHGGLSVVSAVVLQVDGERPVVPALDAPGVDELACPLHGAGHQRLFVRADDEDAVGARRVFVFGFRVALALVVPWAFLSTRCHFVRLIVPEYAACVQSAPSRTVRSVHDPWGPVAVLYADKSHVFVDSVDSLPGGNARWVLHPALRIVLLARAPHGLRPGCVQGLLRGPASPRRLSIVRASTVRTGVPAT